MEKATDFKYANSRVLNDSSKNNTFGTVAQISIFTIKPPHPCAVRPHKNAVTHHAPTVASV